MGYGGLDKYYNPSSKIVYDGDTANAADLNSINSAVDASFEAVADDMDDLGNDALLNAEKARKWAEEFRGVEPDPGPYPGKYSALAYQIEAYDWAIAPGVYPTGGTIHLADGTEITEPSAKESAAYAKLMADIAIGQNTISADGVLMTIITTGAGPYDFEVAFLADPVTQTGSDKSAKVPVGDTADRDSAPIQGYFRFNTELNSFEGYDGAAWGSVGGGAKGATQNPVFFENDIHVTGSYEITTDKNAMSAGPIVIDSGVVVTIPAGSTWTVV